MQECMLNKKRFEEGLKPLCVSICPNYALIYYIVTNELFRKTRKDKKQMFKLAMTSEIAIKI